MAPLTEKLRLLIVIEDAWARDVLVAAAEASEMFGVVCLAEDAHEALAQVWDAVQQQTVPDVILVDLDLEGCSGAQLAAELRRHSEMRSVFIALVAETADEVGRTTAADAGADCFGTYSTSVSEMSGVLREVGRRAIAESRLAIS